MIRKSLPFELNVGQLKEIILTKKQKIFDLEVTAEKLLNYKFFSCHPKEVVGNRSILILFCASKLKKMKMTTFMVTH